jgi:16S rRNA (adenine1518-N6/adenine1519-N6)-dimethyltransferase
VNAHGIGKSDAPRRQTQSYLRNLFATRGITPQHHRGQNFLVDLNLHELIIKTADVRPLDLVLEVGSGTGALTSLLASQAGAVITVEVDRALAHVASQSLQHLPNVHLIEEDILARKNAINPEVLRSIRASLLHAPGTFFKLVANLPYVVATPVIMNFLVGRDLQPSLMVVTIQLELAERMRAEPGSKSYGSLSVLLQALADFDLIRVLPPSVFWPRPKVDSAIVRIIPSHTKAALISDIAWFQYVVRTIFLHRRKNLRRALLASWSEALPRTRVDAVLQSASLPASVRAEALNVQEFIQLAEILKQETGGTLGPTRTESNAQNIQDRDSPDDDE